MDHSDSNTGLPLASGSLRRDLPAIAGISGAFAAVLAVFGVLSVGLPDWKLIVGFSLGLGSFLFAFLALRAATLGKTFAAALADHEQRRQR